MGDLVQFYNTTEYLAVSNGGVQQHGSLVERYYERTRGRRDIWTFARVIEEQATAAGDAFGNACAVHVRTGDVLECDIHTVDEMIDHVCYSQSANFSNCSHAPLFENVSYVRPFSYFTSILSANMSVQD